MRGKAAAGFISRRIPVLRRIPVVRLLLLAELLVVAKRHLDELTPAERRRLVKLIRKGTGMNENDKRDLKRLVRKLEPRAFAGSAAERISPVPVPRRLTKAKY